MVEKTACPVELKELTSHLKSGKPRFILHGLLKCFILRNVLFVQTKGDKSYQFS